MNSRIESSDPVGTLRQVTGSYRLSAVTGITGFLHLFLICRQAQGFAWVWAEMILLFGATIGHCGFIRRVASSAEYLDV